MIQELISTSAPRCLDGNAGFGIVAQTVGMAPNVSTAVNALSGYTHIDTPGSGRNPVVYLHAQRRTGGMLRHIISRVADCGNDYSGRSNRIAHHWIVEEVDVPSLPGGPAEMATFLVERKVFRSQWNEKPTELPPKPMTSHNFPPKKCDVWERLTGDAGWGGIVAERAEKGDPISILFTPEHNSNDLLMLINEALTLLPTSVRWRTTFSTYFMKSQELGSDTIQVKCFLVGSAESQFARQSPNTLVIDLRNPDVIPAGKYVELARKTVKPAMLPNKPIQVPVPLPSEVLTILSEDEDEEVLSILSEDEDEEVLSVLSEDEDEEVLSVLSEEEEEEIYTIQGQPVPTDVSLPGVEMTTKKRLDYVSSGNFPIFDEPSEKNKNWWMTFWMRPVQQVYFAILRLVRK